MIKTTLELRLKVIKVAEHSFIVLMCAIYH